MEELKYLIAIIIGYMIIPFVAAYRVLDWIIFEVKVWWNGDGDD